MASPRGSMSPNTGLPYSFGSLPDCHNTTECNGLFGRNTSVVPVELKSITDGQSNTIMVGETVGNQDFHGAAFFSDGDFATCGVPINYFHVGLDVAGMKAAPQWMQSPRIQERSSRRRSVRSCRRVGPLYQRKHRDGRLPRLGNPQRWRDGEHSVANARNETQLLSPLP